MLYVSNAESTQIMIQLLSFYSEMANIQHNIKFTYSKHQPTNNLAILNHYWTKLI